MAEIYNSESKYQDAAQYITKVVTHKPNFAGALDLAGVIYKNLSNMEKAKEYFQKTCDMGVKASCTDSNSQKTPAKAKPAMKNHSKRVRQTTTISRAKYTSLRQNTTMPLWHSSRLYP
jgi:tetratricopeptide (TPR) repeat protein